MRTTRPSTVTLYQVCSNEDGDPFNAACVSMHKSKREALVELRKTRTHCPEVYLAQITYTRIPEAQKGR